MALTEKAAAGSKELGEQRDRGEWSGLCSASGAPVYTLREIAEAVVREMYKEKNVSSSKEQGRIQIR